MLGPTKVKICCVVALIKKSFNDENTLRPRRVEVDSNVCVNETTT